MDNKKWSKRFSTIFWWVLAFLPLFIALIYFIGYHLTFNSGISNSIDLADYHSNTQGDFLKFLTDILHNNQFSFDTFTPSFVYDLYDGLFDILNIQTLWGVGLFAWATWVFILHVIFDIIIWLPCFLHELIDKFKK